jgi:hypothetical protein
MSITHPRVTGAHDEHALQAWRTTPTRPSREYGIRIGPRRHVVLVVLLLLLVTAIAIVPLFPRSVTPPALHLKCFPPSGHSRNYR